MIRGLRVKENLTNLSSFGKTHDLLDKLFTNAGSSVFSQHDNARDFKSP